VSHRRKGKVGVKKEKKIQKDDRVERTRGSKSEGDWVQKTRCYGKLKKRTGKYYWKAEKKRNGGTYCTEKVVVGEKPLLHKHSLGGGTAKKKGEKRRITHDCGPSKKRSRD